MGEAKRRRKLDPHYGKVSNLTIEFLDRVEEKVKTSFKPYTEKMSFYYFFKISEGERSMIALTYPIVKNQKILVGIFWLSPDPTWIKWVRKIEQQVRIACATRAKEDFEKGNIIIVGFSESR